MRRIAIIGGGISGLTAAYELARLARGGAPVEAILFESTQRLGGIVETVREGGFTVEGGPDGWVSAKPWARELALELGLADELIASNDATRRTWILLSSPENPAGKLVPMPDGFRMMVPSDLGELDHSPLFTPSAIDAYSAEPARADELRAASPDHDESVADFTLRHFGPEVLDRVAAPLLSGVFGGDVRRLSVRAVMPGFVEMEREHGSLIAALKASRSRNGAEQGSIFTTLRSGLGTLVQKLEAAIPPHWIRRNHTVKGIHRNTQPDAPAWTLHTSTTGKHHGSETFDAVFLATPLDASRRLLVVTGPNMGGKSTYMRQIAVIALLAYAGMFVPATRATLGPIDAIHTRIGAADDLAGGRSTFMVEMTEAAYILNRATAQSLVLIDEIGRGTSTFDGLALAWAIAHRLAAVNRSLALFATHYFELTALPSEIDGCANVHFDAVETKSRQGAGIVFLHHVEDGPANRSYGLQVARLAGVPADTLRKAQRYFARLDKFNVRDDAQHDLFAASSSVRTEEGPWAELAAKIAALDPDGLSPREAHAALYELKRLAAGSTDGQALQREPGNDLR